MVGMKVVMTSYNTSVWKWQVTAVEKEADDWHVPLILLSRGATQLLPVAVFEDRKPAAGDVTRLTKAATSDVTRLTKAATSGVTRLTKSATSDVTRLAKTANGDVTRLTKAAASDVTWLTKAACGDVTRLAKAACGDVTRLTAVWQQKCYAAPSVDTTFEAGLELHNRVC